MPTYSLLLSCWWDEVILIFTAAETEGRLLIVAGGLWLLQNQKSTSEY